MRTAEDSDQSQRHVRTACRPTQTCAARSGASPEERQRAPLAGRPYTGGDADAARGVAAPIAPSAVTSSSYLDGHDTD